MTLTVRPRTDDDLPALAEILRRVHARDGYPVEGVQDPTAWLEPPRQLAAWTATDDNTIGGQIGLPKAAPEDDAASVWLEQTGESLDKVAIPVRLLIDPPARRLGAGRELMGAVRGYCDHRSFVLVFDVMLKDHHAIRLYESIGARRLATIEHHHAGGTEPAVVFVAPSK